MNKLLDIYFKRPVIYDYIVSFIIVITFRELILYNYVFLPKEDFISDLSSEIVTILLTFAGFILTFLTVLITFKLDAGKYKEKREQELSLLEKFSHSGLYYQTTSIFKNSIKSVVFISVLLYFFRIFTGIIGLEVIFLLSIYGILILVLTIIRNLLILDEILKLQREEY